ncbi:type II toxin-antitoxin system VapC family toxin [Haloferacaceae archaeon DSL9]
MKLLDTTFLIHYWGGRDDAADYLERREEDSEFVTTTINLKEIAVGRELQDAFDAEVILAHFSWLSILPFRVDHAFEAGRLEAALRRDDNLNGDKINSLAGDVLIGAVANQHDATVVTKNTDDFELLGVDVETD